MKININVIKYRKRDARARFMGFQISENFKKNENSRKNFFFDFQKEKAKKIVR